MRALRPVLMALVLLAVTAAGLTSASADPERVPATDHAPAPDVEPSFVRHADHPDPGQQPSFALFPVHEEVVRSMESYGDHPWVTLHELGTSEEGRPILLAEVTDPNGSVPRDERVVTFVLTQQHGNEPAGTPAALDLLGRITGGDPIADTLDGQVLLLLPMANPDGATLEQRANAERYDINRDHIHLETSEARIIHSVLNDWDVHVAMDHHEYGGQGVGHPSPVRIYDYDLTTLYPVHGNVEHAAQTQAQQLMYDGIWPAAEEEGYTANEYGEVTLNGEPIDELAGGPDPGILRNHLGLHHVAGLLVETFVGAVEHPLHDAERRIAIHATVMDATLSFVHEHQEAFREAKRKAVDAALHDPQKEYIEGQVLGRIPGGYVLTEEPQKVLDLLAAHGIPNATIPDARLTRADGVDAVVVDIRNELRAHAAAMLHENSTRQVNATRAYDIGTGTVDEPIQVETTASVPLVAPLVTIVTSLVVLGLARRPLERP